MQALIRTLWMSGAYAAFETVVASIYIFGAHVPLFLYGYVHPALPIPLRRLSVPTYHSSQLPHLRTSVLLTGEARRHLGMICAGANGASGW